MCPSSVEAFPGDFCVMVRCLLGRIVDEPAESSESESSPDSDSEDDESMCMAKVDGRGTGGMRWKEDPDGRRCEWSRESVLDGGRKRIGELVGEGAALLRAAISRKAATEILWEESEATLFPLGRGMTGGVNTVLDKEESADGDSGRTCRKALRLNESGFTSTLREGGTSATLDFLRSRCAHEKRPPCFFGAALLARDAAFAPSCALGCASGSDLVENALFGSP